MTFNKYQRLGLIALIVAIGVMQYVIVEVDFSKFKDNRVVDSDKLQFYISRLDSLENANRKKNTKYFKFNPNKLSYKSWRYFGLSDSQLYLLDSFRTVSKFSSAKQVREVLNLNDSIYTIIDTLMYFPKEYVDYSKNNKPHKKSIIYKKFNPNKFDVKGWEKLGFSKKQSEIICNYRKKIGGFKVKSDVAKVFVIDSLKYNEMYKYIDLPTEVALTVFDVNTATAEDFLTVEGIGNVYSKVIVDYRNRLGGFYSFYQLYEIKGLDSNSVNIIRKTFTLSKDYKIRVIDINSAKFEELKAHPYVSYRLAREIVDFRENFRPFKSVEEIKNIEEMSDAYFNKIELYLVVDKNK